MSRGFHEPAEKPRRFYKSVSTAMADGGAVVLLDGRNLRTPKGAKLVLPTRSAAELVAAEWAAQVEIIEAATMHATRLANTGQEAVAAAREATAEEIASFAGTDLLCYLAEQPSGLVERQLTSWGPILQRAEDEAGLILLQTRGIVHQPQPPQTLTAVRGLALAQNDFALAGLAFGCALFGSALLSIAVLRGWLGGAEAFDLSRLDEAWQEEQWGVDEEAGERTVRLRHESAVLDAWFRALEADA